MGLSLGLALVCASINICLPTPAKACGGTFCDAGVDMPVDQTGENILFVLREQGIETHIQIQYDPEGEAQQFAWVIPVRDVPEFRLGSERLFQQLMAGSVPRYRLTRRPQCIPPDGDGESDQDIPGGDDGGDPTVVAQDSVGAYGMTVLEGGTADGVMKWLGENGFQQDQAAAPILEAYLAEGYRFLALKLIAAAEVSEIQPVVLVNPGPEPCIPLRLTRIAATEDMEVRAFFLGQERVFSSNYRHVELNAARIDWRDPAMSYKGVVAMAVDSAPADGHGFVTEYAGPSNVVDPRGIYSSLWNARAIEALYEQPEALLDVLAEQGLATCNVKDDAGNQVLGCEFQHAMLPPLLHRYLPVPEGIDEDEFYACPECFADLIDRDAWDAGSLADDLDERLFEPGAHAQALLLDHPYLTRLYTTISPSEMTVDPMFELVSGWSDQTAITDAVELDLCSDDGSIFELPRRRTRLNAPGDVWPTFSQEMPWAERVHQLNEDGVLELLVDHGPRIEELIEAWNLAHPLDDSAGDEGPGGDDQDNGDELDGEWGEDLSDGSAGSSGGGLLPSGSSTGGIGSEASGAGAEVDVESCSVPPKGGIWAGIFARLIGVD